MPFKVLLVIDNAPGHPQSLCFTSKNVAVKFLPANSTSLLQPLDQGAIQCIKATYTRLLFGKLCDTLHANPDCDLTGLWKRFSIADAIALIPEAVHEIKPRTISGCWKRWWRDAVSECEDIGAIDEEVMDIMNIAKELGGEGFSDMIEDDIREHIEDCGEPFTNEELEQLTQSPTGSDDDVMEDTEAQTLSDLTLQKLASIFRQAQVLKDMIAEYDPSMERGIMVTRGITASLKPLQDLFDEAKKREGQLPITMFLNEAAEPNILRREVSLLTSSRNPRTGRSPGDLRSPTESG
uniref:DDE-1 domain-containing protein n=1 Tax=Trichuris muris TaxID=70415 RepID=A0A5S6Q2M8_TRIMR